MERYEEKYNNLKNNKKVSTIIEIILYIVAIAIVIAFFVGASDINNAGVKMYKLKSQSGNTVAEAYYNYYGSFLEGLSYVIGALGITCGIVIAYIGRRVKCSLISRNEINNSSTNNNKSKYEELAKFQRLKEAGTITDAEFEIEKARLLK